MLMSQDLMCLKTKWLIILSSSYQKFLKNYLQREDQM